MEERRPVVKRQMAISGKNNISVVVDCAPSDDDDNDDDDQRLEKNPTTTTNDDAADEEQERHLILVEDSCSAANSENEQQTTCTYSTAGRRAREKPSFHVESVDEHEQQQHSSNATSCSVSFDEEAITAAAAATCRHRRGGAGAGGRRAAGGGGGGFSSSFEDELFVAAAASRSNTFDCAHHHRRILTTSTSITTTNNSNSSTDNPNYDATRNTRNGSFTAPSSSLRPYLSIELLSPAVARGGGRRRSAIGIMEQDSKSAATSATRIDNDQRVRLEKIYYNATTGGGGGASSNLLTRASISATHLPSLLQYNNNNQNNHNRSKYIDRYYLRSSSHQRSWAFGGGGGSGELSEPESMIASSCESLPDVCQTPGIGPLGGMKRQSSSAATNRRQLNNGNVGSVSTRNSYLSPDTNRRRSAVATAAANHHRASRGLSRTTPTTTTTMAQKASLDAASSGSSSPWSKKKSSILRVAAAGRNSGARASWGGEESPFSTLHSAASLDYLSSLAAAAVANANNASGGGGNNGGGGSGSGSPRSNSAAGGSFSTADHHHHHHHHLLLRQQLKTEQLMSKHALKARLSKSQLLLDKAFALIGVDSERTVAEGLSILAQVMANCVNEPKIGIDLVVGLCDYIREAGYLDVLLELFTNTSSGNADFAPLAVRIQACTALEKCLHGPNRDYMSARGFLERTVPAALRLTDPDSVLVVVRLLENLFRHNARTCARLIELSALDYVLNACKTTTGCSSSSASDSTNTTNTTTEATTETFQHAAIALANLAVYGDGECQQKMIEKKVPCWLFLLASSRDDVTRYNACLAICVLVSNKESEAAVIKSGTLALVEPFLLCLKPSEFAAQSYKHFGRPKEFLEKLVQMLNGKRREPRSVAAFHFAMDASIKEQQDRLDILREIGAVQALKQVAAMPEEVAPKFAIQALEIIGESLPYKLSQQVPLWSAEDVQYWISKIGFEEYASAFATQKVDGDLLLLLTQEELEFDIGMKSGLLRKRFMRELDSLKMAADYSCVDSTQLDRVLLSVDPHFSVYTYKLLDIGVDRTILPMLCENLLRDEIDNPVHRMKLCQWMEECKHGGDMEVAMLSKQMDIFISYRRSTGNQLASLLKVLLQLRGYKVFIDVDRLYAGQFDCSLLKNIQAAKHFILVLTPGALDRCIGDEDCNDWVHKEIICAVEHAKNIIPVFDPQFQWPEETKLPCDMGGLARFNGVHWVHEYQEACVDKLEKFIKGELNTTIIGGGGSQRGGKAGSIIGFRGSHKLGSNGTLTGSNSNLYISYADTTELVLEVLANQQRSRGIQVCPNCGHLDHDCVCC